MPQNFNQMGLGLEFGNQNQKIIEVHNDETAEYCCLDIEATGFSEETDDIIEIAAVTFNKNGKIATFQSLIYTDVEIPLIVQDLTGIKNNMLTDAPKLETIKNDLINFIGELPIIGHNINFDLNFLTAKGIDLPGPRIDSFPMSQILIQHAKSYSLETLSHHFVDHQPSHRALDDVLANIELFWYLGKVWQKRSNEISREIISKSELAFRDYLLSLSPNTNITIKQLEPEQPEALTTKIELNNSQQLIVASVEQLPAINKNNNVEQIIPHYETIDPEKFNNFINKESFTEYEALTAVKIAINTENNQLPPLTELQLYGPEANLAGKLTYDQPINFTSAPVSNYVISHNYFFRLLNELPTSNIFKLPILFLDHPFLEETYTRANTNVIHYNNYAGETADIPFGLLGIFWEKFEPIRQGQPLILQPEHLTSQEWQNCVQAFANIGITLPTPDSELIWLTKGREKPPTIQSISKDLDYDMTKIAEKHNLQIEIKNFQVRSDQTVTIHENLPKPNTTGYNEELLKEIDILINESEKDICIITTSHDHIKQIYKHCLKNHPDRNTIAQKLSGSAGKITHKITELEDHNILVCTYQFYLSHKPPLPNLDKLILVKLPIITPNHPFYQMKEEIDRNYFNNYVIPHTVKNLLHTIEVGHSAKKIHLLDTRTSGTNYGQTIIKDLSEFVRFN